MATAALGHTLPIVRSDLIHLSEVKHDWDARLIAVLIRLIDTVEVELVARDTATGAVLCAVGALCAYTVAGLRAFTGVCRGAAWEAARLAFLVIEGSLLTLEAVVERLSEGCVAVGSSRAWDFRTGPCRTVVARWAFIAAVKRQACRVWSTSAIRARIAGIALLTLSSPLNSILPIRTATTRVRLTNPVRIGLPVRSRLTIPWLALQYRAIGSLLTLIRSNDEVLVVVVDWAVVGCRARLLLGCAVVTVLPAFTVDDVIRLCACGAPSPFLAWLA
jgi:hypothetical protein